MLMKSEVGSFEEDSEESFNESLGFNYDAEIHH